MAEEGEVCEMKFCFGDIVVVEGNLIGVVVKSWINGKRGNLYDVYVRMYNRIVEEIPEDQMERYMVRRKYLDEEEIMYQRDTVLGI